MRSETRSAVTGVRVRAEDSITRTSLGARAKPFNLERREACEINIALSAIGNHELNRAWIPKFRARRVAPPLASFRRARAKVREKIQGPGAWQSSCQYLPLFQRPVRRPIYIWQSTLLPNLV